HTRFSKNQAQRAGSAFFETKALERLFHTLRSVIEARNARSRIRTRPAARAGRHKRLLALPFNRHPALWDAEQAEPLLVAGQRVWAAKTRGAARRSVQEEEPWRRGNPCSDLPPLQREPVFGQLSRYHTHARVRLYLH